MANEAYNKDRQSRLYKQLLSAIHQGNQEKVKELIDAGVNINGNRKESALNKAIQWYRWEIVTMLVENGVDINSVDMMGETALLLAIKKGNEKMVNLFIANGANVNVISGYDGLTPLMRAARSGNRRIIGMLIASGANPEAQNYKGFIARDFYPNNEEFNHIVVEFTSGKMIKAAQSD